MEPIKVWVTAGVAVPEAEPQAGRAVQRRHKGAGARAAGPQGIRASATSERIKEEAVREAYWAVGLTALGAAAQPAIPEQGWEPLEAKTRVDLVTAEREPDRVEAVLQAVANKMP